MIKCSKKNINDNNKNVSDNTNNIKRVGIVIALFSSIAAIWSWFAAWSANTISERMLQIEENRKLNENKEKSLNFVNSFYDKIMFMPELYDIYIKAYNWNLNWNEAYFWRFINEYEWLWWKYCQEQIYLNDIKWIKGLLSTACNNKVIENYVLNHSKNTFSKICLDSVWEEWVGKLFNWSEDCRVLQ